MLAEQCLQVVLSTDEQDFTDFCYASEWVRARMILVLLGAVNSGVSRC